ncbi:MAG: hypothetical protein II781_00540, partial [Clostridia bacterium]|nr:hypothetical protein [Clostridia bacterium]
KDIPQDELVSRLADAMGVEIEMDGGNEAYYSAQQDTIHLPAADVFDNDYAFNSTALHELSHSTGHPSRLNRPQSALFGTEQYAYEELVAEMCSCFMGAELRMQPSERQMENHKAYVQAWVKAVREKPDTLIRAIKDAQAATWYMDYKAGLISEKEYEKYAHTQMEVREKEKEPLSR